MQLLYTKHLDILFIDYCEKFKIRFVEYWKRYCIFGHLLKMKLFFSLFDFCCYSWEVSVLSCLFRGLEKDFLVRLTWFPASWTFPKFVLGDFFTAILTKWSMGTWHQSIKSILWTHAYDTRIFVCDGFFFCDLIF